MAKFYHRRGVSINWGVGENRKILLEQVKQWGTCGHAPTVQEVNYYLRGVILKRKHFSIKASVTGRDRMHFKQQIIRGYANDVFYGGGGKQEGLDLVCDPLLDVLLVWQG